MMESEQETMTITVDIPTGKVITVGAKGKEYKPTEPKTVQAVDETGTGLKIACVVLYKKTNPMCYYYYLPNGEEIQICF